MNLVGYLRVSTDRQAEEGFGLTVQQRAIQRWAKANGHKVTHWTRDEGVSGANGIEERPGLREAVALVKNKDVDGLAVARLDRLARRLEVQEGVLAVLWKHGGHVFSVDSGEVVRDDPDDPMRTAMRQMMGVFAQLERATITARLRAGRRVKAEQGGYAGFGSPPFGYKAESGALVPDDEEQAVLARIGELRAAGASLREIAATLTDDGYRPKRSARWHPESLRRIVGRLG